MSGSLTIFSIIIVILSIVAHEVSHGFAALWYGDRTALYAGRLTMNPLKHLDPIGSVILPLFLIITNSPVGFGWAKPVPYNPNNLTDKTWGTRAVAAAGIITNLMIALIFGFALRGLLHFGLIGVETMKIISLIVLINIQLALFNLIPIPPLDGSRLIFSFLPKRLYYIGAFFERYSFVMLIGILILLSFTKTDFLSQGIGFLFSLITGVGVQL